MTLRRRVFPVLPFAQPVGPDQLTTLDALALRRRLLAVLLFRQSGNRGPVRL
jgi:hypothetical protein